MSITKINGRYAPDQEGSQPLTGNNHQDHFNGVLTKVSVSHSSSYESLEDHWVLNLCRWEMVTPSGVAIALTHNELRFLKVLARTPSQAVNRNEILSELYTRIDIYTSRSLDSLVRRLRQKIQLVSYVSDPIKTAHGIGYVFAATLLTV